MSSTPDVRRRRSFLAGIVTVLLVGGVFAAAPAQAHIERPSYWPLPGADCTVHPCAGGKVPTVRTLRSALHHHKHTTVRVVCHADSMKRLKKAIKRARKHGYAIRPHDHRALTKKRARNLLQINRKLRKKCRYHQIQPAVTASNNDDRVVVMPGLYREMKSSRKPTNDPKCARYKITSNTGGDISGAVTYPYQFHCPNDQNLIAVIGRALGKKKFDGIKGDGPHPPKVDRHGIPNAGKCIRCNLQLEGSGVSADDVIVDAGRVKSGNGYPLGSRKDVGIRADRADGFVLRNLTVRHAKEHDIYVIEADGYRLTHFKTYAGGEYGVLTFVGDHGLMDNCDSAGSGDSSLYPGAGAKTSVGRDKRFYPKFRYSQRITHCDAHHSLAGYSGTDGSATKIDHNNFYDNALGFTTDVFTASGHPGFPQAGDLIEHNNFYSNNFNPYLEGSPIHPAQPEPVGTGLWIAGGNGNVIRYNHFYDNWRRGTMLFAVPNALICGPTATGAPVTGCSITDLGKKNSTSFDNKFYGNKMGVTPSGKHKPNGVDFWWDSFPTNTGNCWYKNLAFKNGTVVTSPSSLPSNCASSIGLGTGTLEGTQNELELVGCFGSLELGGYNADACPWFKSPTKPTITSAARANARARRLATTARFPSDIEASLLTTTCELFGDAAPKLCDAQSSFVGGRS